MQELGLIGLRIQRMPSEPDLEFGIPSQYSYMTVKILYCTAILLANVVIAGMIITFVAIFTMLANHCCF